MINKCQIATRFVLLTLALSFSVPICARDKTDVMVMTNGDRLTCEIKGLDAGVLYVSFDYIDGTASVNWSKVARLESNQLFVVKTEGGAVYTGILRTPDTTSDRPVKIQVLAAEKEDVPPGFSSSDYGTSSGISWTFGLK